MDYEVTILQAGFSGNLNPGVLGWSTFALLKNDAHTILLDTGGIGLRQHYEELLRPFVPDLSMIDYVLLTHLHFDHACNVDLIPNATFVCSAAEWRYASECLDEDRFILESTCQTLSKSPRLIIDTETQTVLPGITAIATPGHTPGSTSYLLERKNGEKWLFAGDAAKNRAELRSKTPQMSVDPLASLRSLKHILNISDRILPGHDGWIRITDGAILPEGNNDITLICPPGITINGGLSELRLYMDMDLEK